MTPQKLKETYKDLWEHSKKREAHHRLLKIWDKKLSHLDDETLYYILMRSESILNNRAERLRQVELTKGVSND